MLDLPKKHFDYCIDSKEAPFLVQTDMFFLQPAKTHEAIKVYNTGVDRSYVTFQHLLSDFFCEQQSFGMLHFVKK